MSLTTKIKDGYGSGNNARVTDEGALHVVAHSHPPLDESIQELPYRAYFENGGSNDMIVDGSSTSVDFSIDASNEFDIFITTISVEIGDGGNPSLNDFGDLSALSNGVSWLYNTQDQGDYVLHDGIQTNKEFVRLGISTGAIGTGTDAYLADVSGGAAEKSYLPTINVIETFGIKDGLRLKKGTNDKLIFRVNDALAGLTTFNIIAYGKRL
jgi:hypothetical protein